MGKQRDFSRIEKVIYQKKVSDENTHNGSLACLCSTFTLLSDVALLGILEGEALSRKEGSV